MNPKFSGNEGKPQILSSEVIKPGILFTTKMLCEANCLVISTLDLTGTKEIFVFNSSKESI